MASSGKRVRHVTGGQDLHIERVQVERLASWPNKGADLQLAAEERRERARCAVDWRSQPPTPGQEAFIRQPLGLHANYVPSGFTRFTASVLIEMLLKHHPNRRKWEARNLMQWASRATGKDCDEGST